MGYPGNTTQLTVFCFRNKNCNVSKKNYGFRIKPSPLKKKREECNLIFLLGVRRVCLFFLPSVMKPRTSR